MMVSTKVVDVAPFQQELSDNDSLPNSSECNPCHEQGCPEHTENTAVCDACPFCSDTCNNPFCSSCSTKRKEAGKARGARKGEIQITMCELRRHNHAGSAWLREGKNIYDATPFLDVHPGGVKCIIRKSGGQADCADDMKFHSKKAIKFMKSRKVGTLCRCPGEDGKVENERGDNSPFDPPCVIS